MYMYNRSYFLLQYDELLGKGAFKTVYASLFINWIIKTFVFFRFIFVFVYFVNCLIVDIKRLMK